jgi:putative phosphoribosyl transferase
MDKTSSIEVKEQLILVPSGPVNLEGQLNIPESATAVVIFAHGSGSSRHSPRNQYVAQVLNQAGIATLLIDLLNPEEATIDQDTGQFRFNLKFLAERLLTTTEWLAQTLKWPALKIGYFGASTGAAGALLAAAKHPMAIGAVVSRGGRPDMAGAVLPDVQAPTLLIVGEKDQPVIRLNEKAFSQLQVEKELKIIPGATHLFEEPGALEAVAKLAVQWFECYLK